MILSPPTLAGQATEAVQGTGPGVVGRRYVAPIPACGPTASAWPERHCDEAAGLPEAEMIAHPTLPLLSSADERAALPPVVSVPPASGARSSASSAGDGEGDDLLPDPVQWSHWLARMMIEVAYGRRPVGQLTRWAEERVLATVVLRTRQLTQTRRRRSAAIGAAADHPRAASLGSVRVQRPRAEVVEAMATVRSDRPAAFAFRLEAQGARWLCTAVDFGPQTPQPD